MVVASVRMNGSSGNDSGDLAHNGHARAADRVYLLLKERLMEGAYKFGERLPVAALGREFDVSKQPVMESMRRLSAEGFVTIMPQVGCSVTRYNWNEIDDYFRLFASVEGEATVMAAERLCRSEEPQRELEPLRETSARIGELRENSSPDARAHGYRVLNRQLHSLIHGISHTSIVSSLGGGFFDRSDFLINASAPVSPFANTVGGRHADHEEIIAALADGDAQAARRAAESHIYGTVGLIEAAVEQSTQSTEV